MSSSPDAFLRGPPAKCDKDSETMPTSLSSCADAAIALNKKLVDTTGRDIGLAVGGPLCGYNSRADEIVWNDNGIAESSWGSGNVGRGWKAACVRVNATGDTTLLVVGICVAVLLGLCVIAWTVSTMLRKASSSIVEEIPEKDLHSSTAGGRETSTKITAKPTSLKPEVVSGSMSADRPSAWGQIPQVDLASKPKAAAAPKASVGTVGHVGRGSQQQSRDMHGSTTSTPSQSRPVPTRSKTATSFQRASSVNIGSSPDKKAPAEVAESEAMAVDKKLRSLMDRPLLERKRIIKELLLEYHPDKNKHEHAKDVFQLVNNARDWFLRDA